jgi:hypothetical protein
MVVAWPTMLTEPGSLPSRNRLKASTTPLSGFLGVEGTLMFRSSPVSSSNATRSVNVPPTSTLTLYVAVPSFNLL